jgi:hypothetical protein
MGDRGRNASLRDTNAARADRVARTPSVIPVAHGATARDTRPTLHYLYPHGHGPGQGVPLSSGQIPLLSCLFGCLFVSYLGQISPIKEILA